MFRCAFPLALLGSSFLVDAHMGVSSPIPLDASVGDAFRYPVSSDNNPANGGACHGKTAGANYAWVWTPTSSGTCEIYMNCFSSEPPGDMRMSFGAAHNGGPCKLYQCSGAVTLPSCTRRSLPGSFGTCTEIGSSPDCTTKGVFSHTGGGGSGGGTITLPPGPPGTITLPPPPVEPFPPGATATKIRCGTSWEDANDKCGTPCVSNAECSGTEYCYADLRDCPTGVTEPEPKPVRPPVDDPPAGTCVSAVSHITDDWCKAVKCAPVYSDFCKQAAGAVSSMERGLTANCTVYATFAGETWADVAIIYDVEVADLKAANSVIAGEELVADTVLEVPGDCTTAREQVVELQAQSTSQADTSSAPGLQPSSAPGLQLWCPLGALGTAAMATALAAV